MAGDADASASATGCCWAKVGVTPPTGFHVTEVPIAMPDETEVPVAMTDVAERPVEKPAITPIELNILVETTGVMADVTPRNPEVAVLRTGRREGQPLKFDFSTTPGSERVLVHVSTSRLDDLQP